MDNLGSLPLAVAFLQSGHPSYPNKQHPMSTNDANPVVTPDDDVEVSLYEARKKIQTRSVTGTFANWRWAFVWITQIVFYGLPWLNWNGRQAVLFLSLIHI